MEPSVYGLILLIIIILIGSACCSGVEAAFLAVNSIRILEIASRQKPKSSANQLLKLRKHLGRTLTVITITNNGFNIIGSLILGVYGALVINSSFGLTLFSIAFYILVVLVGEVLPKALGTRFSVQIALLSVPILRILNILMRPFLILIEQISPVITAENEILTDDEDNIVFKTLKNLKNNKHVIVDVENYSQLKKFSLIIKKLTKQKKFLFRTAASFISSISEKKSNPQDEIFFSNLRIKNKEKSFLPGLVIVGSYVELSSLQLKNLLKISTCEPIELDVFEFFRITSSENNQKQRNLFKNKFLREIRFLFEKGKTPVLFTSRKFMSLDYSEQLNFYNSLSCFIAELVADLKYEIGYLISKGGITTNMILSNGLNADYVYLEGQILTGISVVTCNLKNDEKLPIVTHPGNIGTKDSLVNIWKVFENKNNF